MECLRDFVGPFTGCGAPTPLSGMYLSQLPGIEFQNIEQIANKEQVSWSGVWDDVQATTIDTFREDIIEEFGKRYMLKQITQTVDLGKQIDTSILTPPVSDTTNGLLIETMQSGQQCIGSNLMAIYIQQLYFYWEGTDPTPTITITFKDADLLNVERTIVVDYPVAGWNTIWVDSTFAARRLYVLASGNFDNYVKQDLSLFNLDNFGGYTWGAYANMGYLSFSFSSCGIQSRINGVSYNSAANTAITGPNCFGISCVMSTRCTWDSVVCANKKHFASAWQHCLAIELLNYRINTSRVNRWVTVEKKQAQELQILLLKKYRGNMYGQTIDPNDTQYPGKLQNAITSLVLNPSDGCLKANDYMIFRESRM